MDTNSAPTATITDLELFELDYENHVAYYDGILTCGECGTTATVDARDDAGLIDPRGVWTTCDECGTEHRITLR